MDNTIRIWDLATGACLKTLVEHTGPVSCHSITLFTFKVNACHFSPDGRKILSASSDKQLKVLDSTTGECIYSLEVEAAAYCCCWSPDGDVIVAGLENGKGRIWNLQTLEIRPFKFHDEKVQMAT